MPQVIQHKTGKAQEIAAFAILHDGRCVGVSVGTTLPMHFDYQKVVPCVVTIPEER